MLWYRVRTAIFLLPLAIYLLLVAEKKVFHIAAFIFYFLCLQEWLNFIKIKSIINKFLITCALLLAVCLILILTTSLVKDIAMLPQLLFAAIWGFLTLAIVTFPYCRPLLKNKIFNPLLGTLYLLISVMAIVALRDVNKYLLLYAFVLIWSADITAYFVGRKWGRIKIAPHISPGKSLEGALAALGANFLIAYLSFNYFSKILSIPSLGNWLALAIFTTITSIMGDLAESMFKRVASIKDSGNLLPGHGGILDRVDGILYSVPIFCNFIIYWKNLHG